METDSVDEIPLHLWVTLNDPPAVAFGVESTEVSRGRLLGQRQPWHDPGRRQSESSGGVTRRGYSLNLSPSQGELTVSRLPPPPNVSLDVSSPSHRLLHLTSYSAVVWSSSCAAFQTGLVFFRLWRSLLRRDVNRGWQNWLHGSKFSVAIDITPRFEWTVSDSVG